MMPETEEGEDLIQYRKGLRHAALYRAELSVLYHRKRERFLALCDRVGKGIALVAGTAAFSSLLDSASAKAAMGSIVAAATLPGLVFAWADKARLHSELAQKYIGLIAEVTAKGERNYTEEDCFEWQARLRTLEINEPPPLSILVTMCQNQLALAANDSNAICEIPCWKVWLAHFIDMEVKNNKIA